MKKSYIFVPLICVLSLIAIIITVVLVMDRDYLKKLPYDHIDSNVYNGVEVVGEDGLFYLVKDGKRLSEGYSYLQSVNDYYSEDLTELISKGKSVELFDYYIARSTKDGSHLLVNSAGEKFMIEGDSYSLDAESTRLPYLVFTNNANGLKAVISLNRLDSDVSYKSGSELTLRTFREVTPVSVDSDSALCSYLVTEDVSDEGQISYFRQDGMKITTGKNVTVYTLEDDNTEYPLFYNADQRELFSVGGESIATGVLSILRSEQNDWRYAICENQETQLRYAVVFSPNKRFVLSGESYLTDTLWGFGGCIVAQRTGDSAIDVINVFSEKALPYKSVTDMGAAVAVSTLDGKYSYLDENGIAVITTEYTDMLPVAELSVSDCLVLRSAEYDAKHGGEHLHFARAGEQPYVFATNGQSVEILGELECAAYRVTALANNKASYAVLAPFSVVRCGEFYNKIDLFRQNGVSWILATSYDRGVYDVVDPLSSKVVLSFVCAADDFAKYSFEHVDNIALATNEVDVDTAVHMSIVKLSDYDTDRLIERVRYFAIYRAAAYSSEQYGKSALKITEIGADLLIEEQYRVFTDKNYLICYTAKGSEVFSIDDSHTLVRTAQLPYRASEVFCDEANPEKDYFLVVTESGMKGLYGTDSEEVLAPYYENIVHAENGYFLVKLRGAYGVIHAEGGKTDTVVDFAYSRLMSLGDNGYYAVTGEGDTLVFAKKKVALDKSIQSVKEMLSFKTDENGRLSASVWYVISADAKLYIHRSEKAHVFSFGEYEGCDKDGGAVLNERATAVYYYRGSTLLHTDVFYPGQPVDGLYSGGNITEWYASRNAADQNRAVTPEDILGKKIVKLYAKV